MIGISKYDIVDAISPGIETLLGQTKGFIMYLTYEMIGDDLFNIT